MKKEKTSIKVQTAQEFINVEDISDNILYSNDGFLFGYLSVRADNENLMSDAEKNVYFSCLTKALEYEKNPWQLISVPKTVDTAAMLEQLAILRRNTDSDAKLRLISGEIDAVQNIASDGAKEPEIVFKIWEKAVRGADITLKKRLNEMKNHLSENRIRTEILDDKKITYLCKLFADLTVHQEKCEDYFDEDIPTMKGTERILKKSEENRDSLLNIITPIGGLDFRVNRLIVGSAVGRIFAAVRYPAELSYGWAVDIMNCSEAVTAITFYPSDSGELAQLLSGSIHRNEVDAESTHDAARRKKLTRQAKDADALLDAIEFRRETIGHMSILTMPFTEDEEKLDDVCRRVSMLFSRAKIKLKSLGNLQKQGFQSLSPYYVPQSEVEVISKQLTPLYTLAGGSPMTVSVLRDESGYYFAKTADGGILTLDLLYRGGDRTNSNLVVMGKAGTGKSTALKHIMQTLFMEGVKILVIDPESEFRDLCLNLGGTVLDAGGGAAKINPLQVRPAASDDDDEKNPLYQNNESDLALHMKTLEVFLSLYLPSLTDLQISLLKTTILELYEKCKIGWNTDVSSLKNEDFPIFSDLYSILNKKAESEAQYAELAALINDIAVGADSFIWNGHTNIDTKSDFICFDTGKMNNASDKIKRTQYFNLLTVCWEIMSRDRNQPVMLVCDEAYLMIDPEIPQSLMFLRNVEKRCRKYNGILAVVSHSVVDFLDEKVKLYGQSLLDIPTYKLFFGADGKNLKETAALFDLTEPEQAILQAGIRREALVMIGSHKVHTVFEIPDYKLALMGSRGGR